jgi:ferritin
MRIQVQEEVMHAMKFYDYVIERGGRVITAAVEAPPTEWESPLAVFQYTLQHEQKVTGLINALVDKALSEKDHATTTFLQWFVTEQVEEESSADEIVQKLTLVGDQGSGLLLLDQELGQRVFTPPAAEKE